MADNSGNILEAYEYNAQGQFQITNSSGTVLTGTGIANEIMYTGQMYDAETNNYFYNARYYNPQLGRFISRDPLSGAEFSQGTNLYTYCGNDSVNETDPSGMWVLPPDPNHDNVYMYSTGVGFIPYVVGHDPAKINSAGPTNTHAPSSASPRVWFGGAQGNAFAGLGITGGLGLYHRQGAGWLGGWGIWLTLGYGFGVDISGGGVGGTTATNVNNFAGWYDNVSGGLGPLSGTGMNDLGFNHQLGESGQVGPGVTPISGNVSETYTWVWVAINANY